MRPRFSRFNRRESAGLRSEGRRRGARGDPGGTETYPFCSSTSLRPATCQTVPSRSPFSEYKQRARLHRAGTKYNVPPDLPFHLPRFTAFLVLHDPYHRPSSSLLYETSLFPLSLPYFSSSRPSSLSVFHSPPLRVASYSSSLSRSFGSFFALLESLRRDLNSSLPAPFPDFSSVKSALRRAPVRFSHREAPDNS